MKTLLALVGCFAVLAGLAYVLMAPAVSVTAVSEDATACPGDICIINAAQQHPAGPRGNPNWTCFAMTQDDCNSCCEAMMNNPSCDAGIVGEGWCWCTHQTLYNSC